MTPPKACRALREVVVVSPPVGTEVCGKLQTSDVILAIRAAGSVLSLLRWCEAVLLVLKKRKTAFSRLKVLDEERETQRLQT